MNMQKVRPLSVIPDSQDPHSRLDRLGNFDYSNGFDIQLFTRTPNATIYYSITRDKERPAGFIQYNPQQGVSVPRISPDDTQPITLTYTLRAYAVCPGMENSDLMERTYTVTRRPRCETRVRPLRNSLGLTVPDAWLIHDYDNDTMILFNGARSALLFDTGFYAPEGNLYGIVRELTGEDKELYVVLSHNGPDHIQMTWQFIDKPHTHIYINDRDRYMLEDHIRRILALPDTKETSQYLDRFIHNATDGMIFELGERSFRTFEVPGHTFGHICLLDEKNGDFLVADCIGSNSILTPGSLWMWNIVPRVPLNDYLSILHIFRARIRRLPVRHVYTGHYNRPFDGDHLFTYLDHLMICTEKLIDYGLPQTQIGENYPPHAYVPRSVEGDRLTDPWYAGIVTSTDLMYEPEYLDGGEEKNDELCYLDVRMEPEGENLLITQETSGLGISLNFTYHNVTAPPGDLLTKSRTRICHPVFHVSVPDGTQILYVMPVTGSHFSSVYINGQQADTTYLHPICLEDCSNGSIQIMVLSEDGTKKRYYTIYFHKEA